MKKLALFGFLSLLAACGDDTEELTCELLEDPNFCWNRAISQAYACTEDAGEVAMSTEDGAACEYPDGTTVDIDVSEENSFNRSVRVEKDGEFCASAESQGQSETITTPNLTAKYTDLLESFSLRYECEGTTYEASAFDLDCDFEAPGLWQRLGQTDRTEYDLTPTPASVERAWISCPNPEQ